MLLLFQVLPVIELSLTGRNPRASTPEVLERTLTGFTICRTVANTLLDGQYGEDANASCLQNSALLLLRRKVFDGFLRHRKPEEAAKLHRNNRRERFVFEVVFL